MKPSQVQTRMPIHGRLRMNGSEPNTAKRDGDVSHTVLASSWVTTAPSDGRTNHLTRFGNSTRPSIPLASLRSSSRSWRNPRSFT